MLNLVFAFLCFIGIIVMFLHLMRALEKFRENSRDEHAQLRLQLRVLENRLDVLSGTHGSQTAAQNPETTPTAPAPLVLEPADPQNSRQDDPLIRFNP